MQTRLLRRHLHVIFASRGDHGFCRHYLVSVIELSVSDVDAERLHSRKACNGHATHEL